MILTFMLAFGACCLTLGFAVGLVIGTREMHELRRALEAVGRKGHLEQRP
jgi:hypothetical protein